LDKAYLICMYWKFLAEILMMSDPPGSHIRFNPLADEWVLVCPRRGARPQSEKDERLPPECEMPYDPACYLCPGNERASGIRNPAYSSVFAFDNDFPALSRDAAELPNQGALLRARAERGICRVLCYSPRHDLSPARLSVTQLRAAVDAWTREYRELGEIPWINYVQIFENHGALGGASNRHPHSQIWASADVPTDPSAEQRCQKTYAMDRSACLLCDYTKLEVSLGKRVVCENDGFVVVVPYWAMWPFETLVLGKRHFGTIEAMTFAERDMLADIIKRVATRYDNLFQAPFPYSMAIHQAPTDGTTHSEWHFHLHYYSPMRSASVQKVMAGYELGAGRERDDLPEDAVVLLRASSEIHYMERQGSHPL
jgi:UDPglucose--hexose-1-phosphate uridylyltransferase